MACKALITCRFSGGDFWAAGGDPPLLLGEDMADTALEAARLALRIGGAEMGNMGGEGDDLGDLGAVTGVLGVLGVFVFCGLLRTGEGELGGDREETGEDGLGDLGDALGLMVLK